jgi:hypothetical protein
MTRKDVLIIFAALAITVTYAAMVAAQNVPIGAENVTIIQTETSNTSLYPPQTVTAEAGNVTELYISGVTQTKAWQGYYGNVTGTIILEDGQGNRFYDWNAAEPKGEIYASVNNTISWLTVGCAPTQLNASGYLDTWNQFYGMQANDYDQINYTYNASDHPTFWVGYSTMTGCPTTYTFVNNVRQSADFPGVLLSSDNNGTLIYTAVLENKTPNERSGITGFDGENHDFQLLVGENGHLGDHALTTYYFWVELQ